jgi:hypothetical protein
MSAATLVRRGPLAVLVSVALVTTACGSSSGSKSAGGTSSAATSSAATTTSAASSAASAAGTTSAGASSAASSAAATTSSGTSAAPTTKVKASGGGQFCKDVASAINSNALNFSGAGNNVAAEKAAIKKGLQETAGLLLEAPKEIKPDVVVLVNAINQVYNALEKANYDFTKLDPKLLTVMNSAAVKAAGDHVDAYVKTTCGINPNG